jgi:hypothetical protein
VGNDSRGARAHVDEDAVFEDREGLKGRVLDGRLWDEDSENVGEARSLVCPVSAPVRESAPIIFVLEGVCIDGVFEDKLVVRCREANVEPYSCDEVERNGPVTDRLEETTDILLDVRL